MLDISALSQLKQLKKQIQASTIRSKGVVKGTSKRFGFVVDDKDGQQYLLPQESMEKVLPGDVIEFSLHPSQNNKDDRPIAEVDNIISTDFQQFSGEIKVKGQNFFVQADLPYFTRWVFIPPQERSNLKEGDLVLARITQHPFKNKGRMQACIDVVLGRPDDPYIEHRYAIAKENIPEKIWQTDEIEAIRQTCERIYEQELEHKTDCREQVFFTIDGVSTQDLDDALSVVETENGWRLSVAIADVSSFIKPNLPLDKIALQQASSIYLPGQKIPMLPEVISADLCSLRANKDRFAIICQLDIGKDGNINHCQYIDAVITSRARLNYEEVSAALESQTLSDNINPEVFAQLQQLLALSKARTAWRVENAQEPEPYPDYRLWLNERGKITSIEHLQRNIAQTIVEECMIACNEATAQYLQQHSESALFLNHEGFREELHGQIEELLQQYFPEFSKDEVLSLDGFLRLQKAAAKQTDLPWKDILRKKLSRSLWNNQATPHYGLGFKAYTTFTSPIRKYSDILVHRIIKNLIHQQDVPEISPTLIEQLNLSMQAIRNAQRDCEQSLKCQYLAEFSEHQFEGEISMITPRAIIVYIRDFDLHGQIDTRDLKQEFTYDPAIYRLSSAEQTWQLCQPVKVSVQQIDLRQRQVKLKLVE